MANRTYMADLWQLIKPGICVLAMAMAALGFALGDSGQAPASSWWFAMLGIALVGASSGALNMYIEREHDAKMDRTKDRPIPSGRLRGRDAVIMGIICGVLGEAILFIGVNAITGWLGIATLIFYLAFYTPSKRWNSFSTLIGAVPGAMPPLMGFTAARGAIEIEGIVLFMILFVWQVPHFLAIAWLYREDYQRGGFPILSVVDVQGSVTFTQVLLYAIALIPITLLPTLWGFAGVSYFYGALALGMLFLVFSVLLARFKTRAYARSLFLFSIIYLPALGILMVLDHVG